MCGGYSKIGAEEAAERRSRYAIQIHGSKLDLLIDYAAITMFTEILRRLASLGRQLLRTTSSMRQIYIWLQANRER